MSGSDLRTAKKMSKRRQRATGRPGLRLSG